MSKRVKSALVWLKHILDSEHVEYQIVGGLAAAIHGGLREIADIDLYIHNNDAHKILPHVAQFISKPLTHYVGHGWDLDYFQLIYNDQKIEIGLSENSKIQSANDGSCHALEINFSQSNNIEYLGLRLHVMPIQQLVAYKKILAREVDLIDIRELGFN
ncbi:MazG-related protein [Vibrio sp. AK197]